MMNLVLKKKHLVYINIETPHNRVFYVYNNNNIICDKVGTGRIRLYEHTHVKSTKMYSLYGVRTTILGRLLGRDC